MTDRVCSEEGPLHLLAPSSVCGPGLLSASLALEFVIEHQGGSRDRSRMGAGVVYSAGREIGATRVLGQRLNGIELPSRRLLTLAFLSPRIIEAVAEGRQPQDPTVIGLTRRLELPVLWSAQEAILGMRRSNTSHLSTELLCLGAMKGAGSSQARSHLVQPR